MGITKGTICLGLKVTHAVTPSVLDSTLPKSRWTILLHRRRRHHLLPAFPPPPNPSPRLDDVSFPPFAAQLPRREKGNGQVHGQQNDIYIHLSPTSISILLAFLTSSDLLPGLPSIILPKKKTFDEIRIIKTCRSIFGRCHTTSPSHLSDFTSTLSALCDVDSTSCDDHHPTPTTTRSWLNLFNSDRAPPRNPQDHLTPIPQPN